MELRDKVAVVTGSGNGIGEAVVRRFTEAGARVVVTDIEPDSVARVAGELGAPGIAVDITDPAGVRAVADLATSELGPIDIWFSNAGYAGPPEPGELQSDALWDMTWSLHVLAHLNVARTVLPSMIERGQGYLLQTASSVALSMQPEKVAYSVTKHGALALSEWLACQYRPMGIRVSCFCPGAMLTRMLRSNGWPEDHPVMAMAWTPPQVADLLVRGIGEERFLIQTDLDSTRELGEKAADYEAWIVKMSRRVDG